MSSLTKEQRVVAKHRYTGTEYTHCEKTAHGNYYEVSTSRSASKWQIYLNPGQILFDTKVPIFLSVKIAKSWTLVGKIKGEKSCPTNLGSSVLGLYGSLCVDPLRASLDPRRFVDLIPSICKKTRLIKLCL